MKPEETKKLAIEHKLIDGYDGDGLVAIDVRLLSYTAAVEAPLQAELQELKQEISRVWYLAYPDSPQTDKDVAKLRIFNLYQDLECTRFNLRVLNNAYNELEDKKC